MQRIERLNEADASAETAELLAAVKQQMGGVPNILGTMARSHAALSGYLGFSGALGKGKLSAKLREQIALTVAGANGCDYCASVHTAVGGQHGVAAEELSDNLEARSADARTQAALTFTAKVMKTRGNVTDSDMKAARDAGFSDEELIEIVGHVALNVFTNYFNHVAGTEIDFPHVRTAGAVLA
tara:strand:+ start:235 stop:786 length:552 start_codon:yes stop_codon:yes gene_type:complete